jgi:hypothetical protein
MLHNIFQPDPEKLLIFGNPVTVISYFNVNNEYLKAMLVRI